MENSFKFHRVFSKKVDGLADGVNSAVGSPSGAYANFFSQMGVEGVFHGLLHRRLICLELPAGIAGSVVFYGEAYIAFQGYFCLTYKNSFILSAKPLVAFLIIMVNRHCIGV